MSRTGSVRRRLAAMTSLLAIGTWAPEDSRIPQNLRDKAVDVMACILAAVLGALFLTPALRDGGEALSTQRVLVDACCGALACLDRKAHV